MLADNETVADETVEENETPLWPVKAVVGSALIIVVFSAVGCGLWYLLTQSNNHTMEMIRAALDGLFWGFLLALVFLFIALFTGNLEQTSPTRMIWMIRFSYLFTGLALGGSFLPFVLFEHLNDSHTKRAGLEEIMIKNPIGILKGCVEANEDDNIPRAIDCKKGSHYLWVVNIGGSVGGTFEKDIQKANIRTNLDELQPTMNNVVALNGYRPSFGAGLLTGGTLGQETAGISTDSNEFQGWRPKIIKGGLVIPLYVVIISLMGAAVSMTRRVPEFQRRYWAWHRLNKEGKLDTSHSASPRSSDSGPLSPDCARECLIFQMMQVISAPLVAVTAYYAIAPTGVAATVGLAFVAGFASEPVLITISTCIRKLRPDDQRFHTNNNDRQYEDSSSQRTLG